MQGWERAINTLSVSKGPSPTIPTHKMKEEKEKLSLKYCVLDQFARKILI